MRLLLQMLQGLTKHFSAFLGCVMTRKAGEAALTRFPEHHVTQRLLLEAMKVSQASLMLRGAAISAIVYCCHLIYGNAWGDQVDPPLCSLWMLCPDYRLICRFWNSGVLQHVQLSVCSFLSFLPPNRELGW